MSKTSSIAAPSCAATILAFLGVLASGTATASVPPPAPVAGAQPSLVALSDLIQGKARTYSVRQGDTLTSISSRFGEDRETLARQNGYDPRSYATRLTAGQTLVVNNRHIIPHETDVADGVLVNLSQRRVFLFDHGQLQHSYLIAVGDPDWPTPSGKFHIINKIKNKTWIVPASIQAEMRRKGLPVVKSVPPGPNNPLGNTWIGLSMPNIGIHGTISPNSIYRYESHGCMRMRANDLSRFFDEVRVGEKGRVIYKPLLMAMSGGHVYVEAHPNVYRKSENPYAQVLAIAAQNHMDGAVDWQKVAQVLKAQDGIAEDVTLAAASPQPKANAPRRLLGWLTKKIRAVRG